MKIWITPGTSFALIIGGAIALFSRHDLSDLALFILWVTSTMVVMWIITIVNVLIDMASSKEEGWK